MRAKHEHEPGISHGGKKGVWAVFARWWTQQERISSKSTVPYSKINNPIGVPQLVPAVFIL